jgi:hypothetical protein
LRIAFDKNCCWCGTGYGLQVHHWKYDLFSEDLHDLMTFCEDCHKRIHEYKRVKLSFPLYVKPSIFQKLEESPLCGQLSDARENMEA